MTSKRIAITFGVLWISACSSGIPASEEASDIAQSAAVGAATDASVSEALLEKTMAESNATMEASEAPIVVGNEVTHSEDSGVTIATQQAVSDEKIDVPEAFTSYPTIELRRGETIAHFARWSGATVEEIADLSSVSLDGEYPVGLELTLPVSNESLAAVEEQREAHRVARVDGYLASRGGSDQSDFYTVKTGDTAWSISKTTHGIPVWVLESYNPSVNLDRLRPGQELMVPVLTDTLVDAGTDD